MTGDIMQFLGTAWDAANAAGEIIRGNCTIEDDRLQGRDRPSDDGGSRLRKENH